MAEEEKQSPSHHHHHHHSMQYCSARVMSPEIVEVGEDHSRSIGTTSREATGSDIYVAVGRDDLDVLKWTLDHAVSPGSRIYLVHVFPPITYINTPVGRLARSQLSQEQVRVYVNEENNRSRNLLQKYLRVCNDAKVTVETMLLESNSTAKAIIDLIAVANITSLVMGTKRPPCSRYDHQFFRRRLMRKFSKVEFVKKNAPEYCEVTIVHQGKKLVDNQKVVESELAHSSSPSSIGRTQVKGRSRSNLLECVCFSGKKGS